MLPASSGAGLICGLIGVVVKMVVPNSLYKYSIGCLKNHKQYWY